jgi:transcription antitermination factor NusG
MDLSIALTGVIEEINEDKKKLKVMVKIFGRKTPLELSYHASRERRIELI